MNEGHKELISITLTISIVALTLFIIHRFIPSIIWAGVVVIATYPLYRSWLALFDKQKNLAAFLFTSILALLVIIPISWLAGLLIKETQLFISYLQTINREGGKLLLFLVIFLTLVKIWWRIGMINLASQEMLKNFYQIYIFPLLPPVIT